MAAIATIPLTTTSAAAGDVPDSWGGGRLPPTELVGQFGTPIPMKNMAQIVVSEFGLRYLAGQQHSRLTITEVGDRLRYVDTGTQRWRQLPKNCVRETVPQGIAALCSIPAAFADSETMFLEVWPRLGNDYVDTSSLSARYRSWVLADDGRDTVRTGAGDDFVNGAQAKDKVWGGAGDDWLRTGLERDRVYGQDGDDKIVGADGNDIISGGAGDDSLYGSTGDDRIWADEGNDSVVGGSGRDLAYAKPTDRVLQCESVSRT